MSHEGQSLENQLKAQKIRKQDFADTMGITRQTLSYKMKEIVLDAKIKEHALKHYGIKVDSHTSVKNEEHIRILKENIALLKHNGDLREQVAELRSENQILKQKLKTQ